MTRMTQTERRSVAVAEAVVAKHLGLKGPMVADYINFRYAGPNPRWVQVTLRTSVCGSIPVSEEFVVDVGHREDADFEFQARLRKGNTILRCFYWEICLPTVEVYVTSEMF